MNINKSDVSQDSPRRLADKCLSAFLGRKPTINDLPINPFKILVHFKAYYVILNFDNLEGYYIPPNGKQPAIVGIKSESDINRQRFSAAHELCHHLKDQDKGSHLITLQGNNDDTERYANEFAAELLMPFEILGDYVTKVGGIKEYELKKILDFSMEFGVSFRAAYYRLNNCLGWHMERKEIIEKAKQYRPTSRKDPEKKRKLDKKLLGQLIESYQFVKIAPPTKQKNEFLSSIVLSDHMIENGAVSQKRISELIALLRIKSPAEIYSEEKVDEDESQVIGQYLMYQYIFDEQYSHDRETLKILHRKLYACSNFPEYAGQYRETSAMITNAKISPSPPSSIEIDLIELFNAYPVIEDNPIACIEALSKIHHSITQIHPFFDGNGRTSRALMNFQLLSKNIPPFLVSYDQGKKEEYYNALSNMDLDDDDSQGLEIFIYKNIIDRYSSFISNVYGYRVYSDF